MESFPKPKPTDSECSPRAARTLESQNSQDTLRSMPLRVQRPLRPYPDRHTGLPTWKLPSDTLLLAALVIFHTARNLYPIASQSPQPGPLRRRRVDSTLLPSPRLLFL